MLLMARDLVGREPICFLARGDRHPETKGSIIMLDYVDNISDL
jgi:hypothetical protein